MKNKLNKKVDLRKALITLPKKDSVLNQIKKYRNAVETVVRGVKLLENELNKEVKHG